MKVVPWGLVLPVVLLTVALGIAVAQDRSFEAVLASALLLPSLVLLGGWIYGKRRGDF